MNWEEEFERVEKKAEFKFESLKLDFAMCLSQAMSESDDSKKDMAKKIGICENELTEILSAGKNLKLSEVAQICHKLDLEISFKY